MGELSSAGLHLTMDGYVKDSTVFTKETIEGMFAKVIAALDMKALGPAHVYEVPVDPEVLRRVQETGTFEDEGGITAIVVISTSHMSIHCWPLQGFFSLDAFSCKTFDPNLAKMIIQETLGVVSANVHILERSKPEKPR